MNSKIKIQHIVISALILLLCGTIIIMYGSSYYSTITKRSGLNGSMYYYYGLSAAQWAIYTGLVTFFACIFIALQIVLVVKKNVYELKRTYWFFLAYIVAVLLCEIYLDSKFIPKG